MVLTVYKADFSPPVRSVLMTIGAMKLSNVEYVDIDLFTNKHLDEEFTRINPQHTLPTLKDDDFVIWDSHAICTYLVSKYGKDDSLYPKDLQKRAIVDQRLHFDSGVLYPAARNATAVVFFGGEKSFRPEHLAKIEEGYDLAEKFLELSTWIAGDKMTLADICCVATISSQNPVLNIDEKKYPKLSAWLQRCSKLDFFQKYNEPGLQMLGVMIKSKLA